MQIILHIGQPKTASTSIQLYCDRNRQNLAAQGILYPTSLGRKKSFIASFLNKKGRRGGMFKDDAETKKNITAELSDRYIKSIFSDETIFKASEGNKISVKNMLGDYATSWRILCYVRRPDEHIVSHYQQSVRNFSGVTDSFDEFLEKRLQGDFYRYALQMERWEEIFGPGTVEVRVFHRSVLQGNPVEDFMHWVGVDSQTLPPDDQNPANESLDRVGTEIIRFLYTCQTDHPDLVRGYDLEQARRRVRALATNDRLRLDTDRAKRLQEQFREDHERLAERYLSPEHAAILLAPPAEAPLQPPVAAEVLYERMMAVFGNPDFAQLAADKIVG